MIDSKANPKTDWLSGKLAAEMLGVSRRVLGRLGAERRLTRRAVPGGHPKYLRSDVERLARASTVPSIELDGPGLGADPEIPSPGSDCRRPGVTAVARE